MNNIERLASRLSKNKPQTFPQAKTPEKKISSIPPVPMAEDLEEDEENPIIDDVEDDFDEEETKTPETKESEEVSEETEDKTDVSKDNQILLLQNNGIYRAEVLYRLDLLTKNAESIADSLSKIAKALDGGK